MTPSHTHRMAALGCKTIAENVGMSFVEGPDGFDCEIVRLAEQNFFDKHDIMQRPSRVGRAITEMLDDMVNNP